MQMFFNAQWQNWRGPWRVAYLCAYFCGGLTVCAVQPTLAQDGFAVVATAQSETSEVKDAGKGASLSLMLSQPVPYRIFTLADPARMVIDFAMVDWSDFNAIAFDQAKAVTSVRVGGLRPGWSRMVLDLAKPLAVDEAQLRRTETGARLDLSLESVSDDQFSQLSGVPETQTSVDPDETALAPLAGPQRAPIGARPLRVVLDPGHGGIDPGAQRDGHREADLMLSFALELKAVLLETGNFEVILTREDDTFVSLETRVAIAQAVAADVFISLHADAIEEGIAQGATLYTLDERASDEASRRLAERHDRSDILSGVDLSDQDDVIVKVLLDMARTETAPRTARLAQALVERLQKDIGMYKRPHLQADFSVLKSAQIPSVLLELGFLSSPGDRDKLMDALWRAKAADAIRGALSVWVASEQDIAGHSDN
jgi:N-acetylmuramoyl-L-alanine amidase